MQTTEIPIQIGLPQPKTPRSKGIHVSAIIRCIATETGILKPEWAEELSLVDVRAITDPVAILRINIGLAWEEHFCKFLEDVIDHPGEMQLDGIYMTHDGESLDVIKTSKGETKLSIIVHEYKTTYKSTRSVGDLSTQWMWLMQMKAYAKALNTTHARMYVLFMCGDYTFPIKPQLKCWNVEFTEEEINDSWNLLRDYKESRLRMEQLSLEDR